LRSNEVAPHKIPVPTEIFDYACSTLRGRVSEDTCGAIRYHCRRRTETSERWRRYIG
jgi:hypothetical protein